MAERRRHLTLVQPDFIHQTSRIPPDFWEPWAYLMAEALHWAWIRAQKRLRLLIETSFSVDGWGAQRIVEAMHGEVEPRHVSAAAQLAPGALPAQVPEERPGVMQQVKRGLRR